MSWRQHLELVWRGSGTSWKQATIHTAANPPADPGGASAIVSASQACSAGYIEVVKVVPSLIVGGSLGSSPYHSAHDYLQFFMRSAAGELVEYNIPAPLAAALPGGTGSTLDPSNALIADVIEALIAHAASSSGSPLVSFVRGERKRLTLPRSF